MSQVRYIVTVPHAACPPRQLTPENAHPCDLAAPEAAEALAAALAVPPSRVISGTIPRDIVDMNRPQGRYLLRERSDLRRLIKGEGKERVVVIDVHSYDGDAPWHVEGATVAVLDSPPFQAWGYTLAATIPNCIHVEGSMQNDIIVSAKEAGVPAILVEYLEGSDVRASARATAGALGAVFGSNT